MNSQSKNNLPKVGRAYEELNRKNVPTGNLLGLNAPRGKEGQTNAAVNLEGLFDAMGPFTAGIFLDNDPKHRASVEAACGHAMTVIPVPESRYGAPSVPIASPTYVRFLEKMSPEGNNAAKVISRMCLITGGGLEALDNESGIRPSQVTQIKEWIETHSATPGARLVAVFDFDRTISVIEGGYFLENSLYDMKKLIVEQLGKREQLDTFIPGLTAAGYAEYLAGGHERMTMLQEMFDSLYEKNVKVLLLTNNGGCVRARNLFRELMMVYTRNRPVDIICGIEFGYNKGDAVKGRPTNTGTVKSLREMCIRRGGSRKKTRKAAKKQKKTRRRSA
jgi:hypothetical protein